MQPGTLDDAEELRRLAHELSEALTATKAYLCGGQHLESGGDLRAAIGKAIEQINRAGEVVARLRSIASRMDRA
jgi:phosphoglycerate-specific signal transduction histidine kinase